MAPGKLLNGQLTATLDFVPQIAGQLLPIQLLTSSDRCRAVGAHRGYHSCFTNSSTYRRDNSSVLASQKSMHSVAASPFRCISTHSGNPLAKKYTPLRLRGSPTTVVFPTAHGAATVQAS